MGYTHYWRHSGLTNYDWNKITHYVKKIADASDVEVEIDFQPDYIRLNGIDDDSYEDFYISVESQSDFCKTARRPYDEIVVAILMLLEDMCPTFSWSSDGDPEDHVDGLALFNKVCND